MTAGRPQKDLTELPSDWQHYILTEMNEGCSLQEIKTYFHISNDLHDRWMQDEDEYSETIKEGIRLSESWWLMKGRKNLENKEFSATLWYMNMKNRFGWKDRSEVDNKITGELKTGVADPIKAAEFAEYLRNKS